MATTDVEDFIGQNRLLSDFVEKFRGLSESDKQWKYRREFLFRNISNYEEEESRVDHLLAMSMVWANHVFLGCRSETQTNTDRASFVDMLSHDVFVRYKLENARKKSQNCEIKVRGENKLIMKC